MESIVKYDQVVLVNNIFRDLLIGLIFMFGVDLFKEGRQNRNVGKILLGIFLFMVPFISSLVLAIVASNPNTTRLLIILLMNIMPGILFAENNIMVLLIPLLYIFKDNRKIQCLLIALTAIIYAILESTHG